MDLLARYCKLKNSIAAIRSTINSADTTVPCDTYLRCGNNQCSYHTNRVQRKKGTL